MNWIKSWKSGIQILALAFFGALTGLIASLLLAAIFWLPFDFLAERNFDDEIFISTEFLSFLFIPWFVGGFFQSNGVDFSDRDRS